MRLQIQVPIFIKCLRQANNRKLLGKRTIHWDEEMKHQGREAGHEPRQEYKTKISWRRLMTLWWPKLIFKTQILQIWPKMTKNKFFLTGLSTSKLEDLKSRFLQKVMSNITQIGNFYKYSKD